MICHVMTNRIPKSLSTTYQRIIFVTEKIAVLLLVLSEKKNASKKQVEKLKLKKGKLSQNTEPFFFWFCKSN